VSRRPKDDGFTLVELLVAMTILGLVMAAITGVLYNAMFTSSRTNARINESSDRQRLSLWLARDVENAKGWSTSTGTCTPAGNRLVLALTWTDKTVTATNTREINYSATPVSGNYETLVRSSCTNGTRATQSVGMWVTPSPVSPGTPSEVVTCLDAAYAAIACTSTSVRSITLTITESGGSFSATGTRRAS
jgi:prepilin-type N-terminal cleavage/methylation domain-containing protein